ncbi:MAG TPA: hypothetical protein VN513_10180 [Gemmatimonadales bacterium]|nr:hypothetical protein [Gemmatimonadales bacterium]
MPNAHMTWEEKFEAINALGEAVLKMRAPGDWHVYQPGVDISNRVVIGSRYGSGRTPEAAVQEHWTGLTELRATEVIVINAFRDNRRHLRWNGYRWVDLPVEHHAEAEHA